MSEEVLGIKKEDWREYRGAKFNCNCSECKLMRKKLVPVVSVEWLEEYCKEHLRFVPRGKGYYVMEANGLLRAVRLQVKKEAKKK